MFNQAIIMGNLTRDPEVSYTPSGKAVCKFAVASNERRGDKEEVLFLDVEAWDKQAENVGKYLTKGSPVLVQGKLRLDRWEDKNTGEKKSRMKLVAFDVRFLPSRDGSESGQDRQRPSGPSGNVPPMPPAGEEEDYPF